MATLYQKVKKRLAEEGPITSTNLADLMGADRETVRQALWKLRRRGKANVERCHNLYLTALWTARRP